jgi:hypothetical protein
MRTPNDGSYELIPLARRLARLQRGLWGCCIPSKYIRRIRARQSVAYLEISACACRTGADGRRVGGTV